MKFFTAFPSDLSYPDENRILKVKFRCQNLRFKWISSERNIVLRSDKDCYGKGDPHFQQPVTATNGKITKLCYDVTGYAGDVIHIMKEVHPTNVSIFGTLKDDYYMHKINIVIYSKMIEIGINEIWDSSQKTPFSWQQINSNPDQIKISEYQLIMSKNILILISNFKKFERIIIRRKLSLLTGYHLDVEIKGLTGDYDGLDGLIGRIGQNKYEFFLPVQSDLKKGSVKVNDKLFSGEMKNRGQGYCWYLNVKYLLSSSYLSNYLNNTMKFV